MTLGTLKWLASAFGLPRPQLTSQGLPLPIAPSELAYGWSGGPALFNDNTTGGAAAAGTVFATVTIPDDGFYCLDASWAYGYVASAPQRTYQVRLQILDPTGIVQWQLNFWTIVQPITAVGVAVFPSAEFPTTMLHLPKGAIVRWVTAVLGVVGETVYGSIALRLCYQDNM